MVSVKDGCAGFCFKFSFPFPKRGLEGDFIFETVTIKLCSLPKKKLGVPRILII